MEYDQFLNMVQRKVRLASHGEAVEAIHATLETLGERLDSGQTRKLAAQLPHEIGFYLTNSHRTGRFDLDEFFERVSHRPSANKPDAVHHARVVIVVMEEAVTPQLLEKVLDQLPADFNPLFESRFWKDLPNW